MATQSSTFAWKIPWTEEPGGLQSMGLQNQTRLNTYTPRPHPRLLLFLIRLLASVWNLILRFFRSALEVLLVLTWEPRCFCFAALSWQGTGKQQVAMYSVCSWTGSHVINTSSPHHLQCGSLLSPSSKLRFTSLKEEFGHC